MSLGGPQPIVFDQALIDEMASANPQTGGDWLSQSWGTDPANGSATGVTNAQAVQYGGGIVAGLGAIAQGYNSEQAGQIQSNALTFSSQMNLARAAQAGNLVGQEESFELGKTGQQANAITGQERSAYGASNMGVNGGSPQAEAEGVQKEQIANDYNTRVQAVLQKFGVETQALSESGQQKIEALGAQEQGTQSFLMAGAQAATNLESIQAETARTRMLMSGGV